MARELQLDVEVTGAVEADAAIARLALAFQKAGDSAEVAAAKADKFEKTYKDGTARKKAKDELDQLSGSTTVASSATDKLTAAVMRYAGPAVVLEAARRTIAWADDIEEMATRTSLTVVQVQQLTKVAEKNASTFGAMAGLIQQAEQRLAGHNKQAEAAVRLMGLAPEALLKMDPLERLRAIAKGLADMEDPAKRSAAEMAVFGRSADAAAVALNALAAGADKTESALGPEFIKAGADAQDMLETLTNKALELGKALILLPSVIGTKVGEWGRDSTLGTAFEMLGLHGSRKSPYAGPQTVHGPASENLWRPPTPTPAGAIDLGGNSQAFIERSLRLVKGTKAKPGGYGGTPWTSTLGSSAASIFMLGNSPALLPFSLPFMASPGLLASSAGPLSFANGSGLAGTVGMNAPGGQSFLSKLFGGGKMTNLAAGGVGLLSQLIPGINNAGSSIGSLAGSFFGPLGSALGGLGGGLIGKLFGGGKAEKNARNAETSKVFEQFSTKEFIELQKQAEKFGISMDKALSAKTMKDFGAAVDEVNAKLTEMNDIQSQIDDLVARTTVGFDEMNAVVKEFGLDITKMGPAFQQAAIDKEAQRIIDAFAIMEKGGADMNGVLEGMSDEISKVVQDSIKFGSTIPENMRPWVNKLIESGKLLDENGNAITDISKVKWGAAMESDMSKLTKKLDELIQKLSDLADGFRDATGAATDLGNVDVGNPGGSSGSGNNESGFSTGGMAGRDFRRPGHGDIFPALLRRGETVLPPGVSRGGVSLSIGNLSVSGGYRSRTDAVEEIGEAVVRYIERRGGRLVA